MPFSNCQRCGRLFHRFDPTMPESVGGYWPNLSIGDAAHEVCPECLKAGGNNERAVDFDENGAGDVRNLPHTSTD